MQGGIVVNLQNRFKEVRRTPKKRQVSSSSSIRKEQIKKPVMGADVALLPEEDSVSHERHIKCLKAELKKMRRNPEIVDTH